MPFCIYRFTSLLTSETPISKNMIAVPFAYFLFLFFFHFFRNEKKVDIACYILMIYTISSLCSIFLEVFNIRSNDTIYYTISVNATFVYCALITLGVYPFMKYPNTRILKISSSSKPELLKLLSWLFFLWFVLYTVMSFGSLVKILTGDMGELRNEHYLGEGEVKWFASFPFVVRLPFSLLNLITGSPWILLFLGFYCIAIQKLPNKYGLMYVGASLIGIVRNIVAVGRSDIIYWLISVGACCVFFYPYFSQGQWKKLKKYLYVLIGLFIFYIIMTTVSRFGDREMGGEIGGAEGGFLFYAGQSFRNFCFFWDTFTCPLPSLEVILPFTYTLLGFSTEGGAVAIQQMLSMVTNYELGVFYTYIGQIAVASSNNVAIVYCIVLAFVSLICAKNVLREHIGIFACYMYLVCSSVIFLGLFSHYYCNLPKSFSVIAFSLIIYNLSKKQDKTAQG